MDLTKKLILPVGLFVALFVAILVPEPGIICKNNFGIEISVIIIFLVSGYFHKLSEIKLNKYFLYLLTLAVISNLIVLPFIGAIMAKFFLPFAYALGVIVIVAMPSTLSSALVITEVAEGNAVLAIVLTICLNLLGLISIPIILEFLLDYQHGVSINSLELFIKLVSLILLPLVVGKAAAIKFPPSPKTYVMKLFSPISIVAIVWMCLSSSSRDLFQINFLNFFYVLITVTAIHLVYLIFNYCLVILLKVSKKDMTAFIFVASQKTMPLAILVLYSISGNLLRAVIACICYHFMQILIDSIIAAIIAKKKRLY